MYKISGTTVFVIIAAFLLVCFGLNILLAPRDLWVQDEARYGTVVQEMLASHAWLVPTVDGRFYPDKPPLYFWLAVAQTHLTGLTEASLRLITFYSTAAFAGAFFLMARRLLGTAGGLVAVLVTLSCLLFLLVGNIVRMDMLMTALVTVSVGAFQRGISSGCRRPVLIGYLWALAAAFVKGPLGFAFPVLFAVTYSLVSQSAVCLDKGALGRLRLAQLPAGLLIAGGATALWVGTLLHQGHGDYLRNIWFEQIVGRSVGSGSHREPFFFYAAIMPLVFMPWTPWLYRSCKYASREIARIALAWFLPGFILISLVHGKLFIYLLPLLPPLALLTAAGGLSEIYDLDRPCRRRELLIAGGFYAALGTVLVGCAGICEISVGHAVLITGILLAVTGAAVCLPAWWGRCRTALALLVASAGVVALAVFGYTARAVNPLLSPAPVGRALARLAEHGYSPVAAKATYGIFGFYSGLVLPHLSNDELLRKFSVEEHTALLVRNKRWYELPPELWRQLTSYEIFHHPHSDGYTIYLKSGDPLLVNDAIQPHTPN